MVIASSLSTTWSRTSDSSSSLSWKAHSIPWFVALWKLWERSCRRVNCCGEEGGGIELDVAVSELSQVQTLGTSSICASDCISGVMVGRCLRDNDCLGGGIDDWMFIEQWRSFQTAVLDGDDGKFCSARWMWMA